MGEALDQLARFCGIELEYLDVWGNLRTISDDTKRALLKAMGIEAGSEDEAGSLLAKLRASLRQRIVEPVLVVRDNGSPIRIVVTLHDDLLGDPFELTVVEENGTRHSLHFVPGELEGEQDPDDNRFARCVLEPGLSLGPGYHWVEIRHAGYTKAGEPPSGKMRLIVAPKRCYVPSGLDGEGRVWGPSIQLYALSSGRNWGIGDLTDLKTLTTRCADMGAGIVGINPLHCLFPGLPGHASPYSPSSRTFLNFLYIDVEAVADFAEHKGAGRFVADPGFQVRLASLREAEFVDYEQVAEVKRTVLEMLYDHFLGHHLKPGSERGLAFRTFQAIGGEQLHAYGVFETLQEHFSKEASSFTSWRKWPEEYRTPWSAAVEEFASTHRPRVEFFQYLQWQAEVQMAAAGRLAVKRGLKVGLYEDLAVGVNPDGFEAWFYQDIYAPEVHIGAPPDDFNLNGQDWGLPPMIPSRLREVAYAPLISTLRSSMRHGGAIRVDHIMAFMRLFWVPPGCSPKDGAYVSSCVDEMLGILALESRRNRCLVIGEDLGTVPGELRGVLKEMGVFSYRLLYFEREDNGAFKTPAHYPEQALVAVTTHDLPTLPGYWQGCDLEAKAKLGLFPSEESRQGQIIARSEDRLRLLFALQQEGLLPEEIDADAASLPEMSAELVTAIYGYLAQSPAKILVFQIEDILGQLEQVNLPGTDLEYPNWRRKLPALLESLVEDPRLESLSLALAMERGTGIVA